MEDHFVKISELIPTLSTLMREIGDAEVCIKTDNNEPVTIDSVMSALNVDLPNSDEKGNVAVLKGLSSS
jgi:hypothetical protein